MSRISILLAALIGFVLTVAVAASLYLPPTDAWTIAGIAAGAALLAGGAGGAVLVMLRRRSLGRQATVAGLTSTIAVVAGASAAAEAMFLSSHDLQALLIIVTAAGAVGVVTSLFLGMRIAMASRALAESARVFGTDDKASKSATALPSEFAMLARELEVSAARVAEARRREAAMEQSRRELVGWVSHDLRTPLAGVRAMAEALEDGIVTDPATVNRYYRSMRTQVDHLAGLVDDLFELSRIDSGTLQLHMERVLLSDLVSDALASAAGVARIKNVRLEGQVKGESPEVELSVREMTRVLRNLLDNAIRHTPADGTVSVETGVSGDHAYFSLLDSCGGIPQHDIERVFEVAFRGGTARTPGGNGGGGLGLAIARGVVEAHQGNINVHNEARGCRFTVRLPLSPWPTA